MDALIYEPLKYYTDYARPKHLENLNKHFDSLVAASGMNADENRATVIRYKEQLALIEKTRSRLWKYRIISILLFVLAGVGALGVAWGIHCAAHGNTNGALIAIIGGVVLILTGLLVHFLVMRKKIKTTKAKLEEYIRMAEQILREAQMQMSKLNSLFDDIETFKLIEMTMPELKFDRRYSNECMHSLASDFDYCRENSENISAIDLLSGSLFENPFVFERFYRMDMGTFTYTGTKTISWTETYRDSKGNTRTRRRTQTLYANVTKPKPYYRLDTQLSYGSLACPDLSFTRHGHHVEDLSESQRERKVRRGSRKLKRKSEKAMATGVGGNFREMANDEFDVLFGASNRDNEIQFRVMYTPLAQRNTVDLITTEAGYGDDFSFTKSKRWNVIRSEHAQTWSMQIEPNYYCSYDIDDARAKFISFNENYFKSVFFDFAPLIAVPVYHDEPTESMKTPDAFKSNYSPYEHEALANSIGAAFFKHPASATDAILKTEYVGKVGNIDRVRVVANSFTAEPRVDFVSVLGGDGRYHTVSVPWQEYIPVSNASEIAVGALNHSTRNMRNKAAAAPTPENAAYLHGLLAYPILGGEDVGAVFGKYI